MIGTAPVYTPRRPCASNIDLHSVKTELISIHFTMWLLFLPCSAPAKVLLNYMFKKQFYGRNVVETRAELAAHTGLTVRQIRDIIRELTKINYIFHTKLSGKLSELSLNLPVIESDRDNWIATSKILGRGTDDERRARANQVISIPKDVIFANNKGYALAAGLVTAYDAFFLNIYALSRESGINIACIKLALKIAVQSGGYEHRGKCYYVNKQKLGVFWLVLTHTINASGRKPPIAKNDVPDSIRAHEESSAETTAQQGLQGHAGQCDESAKMTSLKDTQRDLIPKDILNINYSNFTTDCITSNINDDSVNKLKMTITEFAKYLDSERGNVEFNELIDHENCVRPRGVGYQITRMHVLKFLTHWYEHEKPRRCYLSGWIKLLAGFIRKENALVKPKNPNKVVIEKFYQLVNDTSVFDDVIELIDIENRERPRNAGYEITTVHLTKFIQHWTARDIKWKYYLDGWLSLFEGFIRKENAFHITPDYVPHPAYEKCQNVKQIEALENIEIFMQAMGYGLRDLNKETIDHYIVDSKIYAMKIKLSQLVGPFTSMERHVYLMLCDYYRNKEKFNNAIPKDERASFFKRVIDYFESFFSASIAAIREPNS